jgi:hypothetical protein
MKKNLWAANPLKTVMVIGLALALIISWGIVFFALTWGRDASVRGGASGNAFSRSLRDYDLFNAPRRVMSGENPNQIERRLSALQRQARRVEEHLSVLKRRRELALIDRRYILSYAKAAQEAADTFPYSAPLAAIAAEATLLAGTPLPEDSLALLKTYASRITQSRFDMLGLSLHILAGNLASPVQAAGIPAVENLLSLDFSGFPEQIKRDLEINEFLLLAYKGDTAEASWKLNNLLSSPWRSQRDIQMGAEFFYDHNFPYRAAELFLQLGSDADNARAADALAIAGEIPGARNIWLALSSPSPQEDSQSRRIRLRSLYNLAASSATQAEETLWLERLFTQQRGFEDRMETYSIVRYTRLLDSTRGIAILDDANVQQNPLLDLELLRRRIETLPHRRAAAEVWLLVGRHSESEAIYEWAAWYFEHQRLYSELAHLLIEAGRNQMTGSWLYLHRGLAFIRDGRIPEAESAFREGINIDASRSPPARPADWRIFANLGHIQENRRVISAALEYYEAAAALVKENQDAAQLQVRIGRCLEALGRIYESRRAFERALELDPYDLNIRRQVRRFTGDHL